MRGVALALVLLLSPAGSQALSATEPQRAALGESFSLRVGESVQIESEALQIGFDRVTSDSRCPKGEQCVWEGDASVRVWAQQTSKAREELELHTSMRDPHDADYQGYSVRLMRLDPVPVTGKVVKSSDYVATLVVRRGSSADSPVR